MTTPSVDDTAASPLARVRHLLRCIVAAAGDSDVFGGLEDAERYATLALEVLDGAPDSDAGSVVLAVDFSRSTPATAVAGITYTAASPAQEATPPELLDTGWACHPASAPEPEDMASRFTPMDAEMHAELLARAEAVIWHAGEAAAPLGNWSGITKWAVAVVTLEATHRATVAALTAERTQWEQDIQIAAGECLVPIPAPGSDMSRVMLANRQLARQRDDAARATDRLLTDALDMATARGWAMEWPDRYANLVLEASEFTEAWRGKHGDPVKEAGDVLLTYLLALGAAGVSWADAFAACSAKVAEFRTRAAYPGEFTAAHRDAARASQRGAP